MAAEKLNFTKTGLGDLRPARAGKRAYYRDTKVRGLVLAVTDKGAKSFQVYRWVNGRPERFTIGRFPDWTIEKARSKAEKINGAIADRVRAEDLRESKRGEWTLLTLFEDFLEHKRNRRGEPLTESTKTGYRGIFKTYLHRLSVLKLSEIQHADVRALHGRIGKSAPYAANRALALLSSLYGYAKRHGNYRGENPAAGTQKFPEDSRERFVGPEELPYFFRALAEEPTDYRDVFLLGLLTGARRMNVLSMRWQDVNLERGEWRIPRVKHGGSHTAPLTVEALEILTNREAAAQALIEASKRDKDPEREARAREFVFPSRGRTGHLVEAKSGWSRVLARAELLRLLDMIAKKAKWNAKRLQEALEEARANEAKALKTWREDAKKRGLDPEKAKLADLRVHDLRHTIGGALAASGANTATTMQALGHKTATASLIYQKLHRDPIREAMQRATGRLLAQVGATPGNVSPIKRAKRAAK